MQSKCVLNALCKSKAFVFSCFFCKKRYYTCKAYNNCVKKDDGMNNTIGQDVRNKHTGSQGDLDLLKKEIRRESKRLSPLLVNSIKQSIWPMLEYNKDVRVLVKKRQKYLALLSNQYGLRSITVIRQIEEWLCQVDLRITAIETVYCSSSNFMVGVNNSRLKCKNLISYLNFLKYHELKFYQPNPIKRIIISKKSEFDPQPPVISTIKDCIVQTLFVQVLEPIIDPHADYYSFGYRKGRNAHQAIGVLSKLLAYKTKALNKRYLVHSKFVINIEVKQFFDKVNQEWLLGNYPFPIKFIPILKGWLLNRILFHGSAIGPSLVNYTLNGLEQISICSKQTVLDFKTFDFYVKQGHHHKKKGYVVRKALSSSIVRYVDDFILVVNDKTEAIIINNNIKLFLVERGLEYNQSKSKIFPWENKTKFDYLGFTFHYILKKRTTKVSAQKRFNTNGICGGLYVYVYPSKIQIQMFKNKIKSTINRNLNVSPYRLVKIVNPIISSWGKFFGIGAQRVFAKLDYYIHYRLWRYLRRKFSKVPIGKLVKCYFHGVETPSKRAWQFYGTSSVLDTNILKRKRSVTLLNLLRKLNRPMYAQMFNPSKNLTESTYFIDEMAFKEYNVNIVHLKRWKKV